jgi:hypothetical protein
MNAMNEQELSRAIREVIKLASVDPGFRAKAITDPKAALVTVAGKDAASGVNIRFVDDFGSDIRTVVLPEPDGSTELSEEDLEQVAGGCILNTGGDGCMPLTGDPSGL